MKNFKPTLKQTNKELSMAIVEEAMSRIKPNLLFDIFKQMIKRIKVKYLNIFN